MRDNQFSQGVDDNSFSYCFLREKSVALTQSTTPDAEVRLPLDQNAYFLYPRNVESESHLTIRRGTSLRLPRDTASLVAWIMRLFMGLLSYLNGIWQRSWGQTTSRSGMNGSEA